LRWCRSWTHTFSGCTQCWFNRNWCNVWRGCRWSQKCAFDNIRWVCPVRKGRSLAGKPIIGGAPTTIVSAAAMHIRTPLSSISSWRCFTSCIRFFSFKYCKVSFTFFTMPQEPTLFAFMGPSGLVCSPYDPGIAGNCVCSDCC